MNNKSSAKQNGFNKLLFGQLIVALVLGAMQVFAFAPFEQWKLIYPSFIGFFLLLEHVQKTTKHCFLISFTFSISMFIATLHWIYVSMDLFGGMPFIVSALLIVVLCAYLALFPTLALWASTQFPKLSNRARYLLLIPTLWLLCDWLRGYLLTGFPWAYLGYSHADTPLAGYAPILGVQGITLAIMMICGALTLFIKKQQRVLSVAVIVLLFTVGFLLQKQQFTEPQSSLKVALVQGNIDQHSKWKANHLYPSLFKYLDLSEIEEDSEPELIIWPESAIAALEIDMQRFLQPLSANLEKHNKTLITGVIGYELDSDSYYNTIIALGKLPKGQEYTLTTQNRYQKHQLLPIGEFVPFEDLLRPLAPYFNLPMSSFQRGKALQKNLDVGETKLASALCYEIAFSELLRNNIDPQTGLLLTVSNDAWFGDSIGPAQHLQIARMRAIEFARPVLRVTNNGITAIFDGKGEELSRLISNRADVLHAWVKPATGSTPYQTYGSLPLYLYCMLIMVGLLLHYRKVAKR